MTATKEYPRMVYSKDSSRIVQSADEEKILGSGWVDTPGQVAGAKPDANGFVKSPEFDSTPVSTDNDLPLVKEGNTYYDRVVWQAQRLGIKIDKRWSLETLLRVVAEYQPLSKEGIQEANAAIPDDQALDHDPTLSSQEREVKEKVDAELKARDDAPKTKAKANDGD